MSQELKKESLAEQLLKALRPPCEEDLYKAYFKKEVWSLDIFSALMGGISPEKAKDLEQNLENADPLELKRLSDVSKIKLNFLKDFDEISLTDNLRFDDDGFYMSAWRFIKWIAMNDMPLKKRFLEALPLVLLEIYLEFQVENTALRTKPKRSQAYHRALYLKNAKKLISKTPHRLSREEIYSDSHMQNVLRQIRKLGGHYTKRTIKTAWLAKLEKLGRGRPEKDISVD